jgi:hypothetical protein
MPNWEEYTDVNGRGLTSLISYGLGLAAGVGFMIALSSEYWGLGE